MGGERAVQVHRQCDADCEPAVRERDRACPAAADQEERSNAEQRRRQERACAVVDAE